MKQYRGLPRQVYMLCAARIITAMGAFVFSFSSLLMTGILGLSEIAAGYMMIASSLASIVGALLCGRLADSCGRKKVLLVILSIEVIVVFIGGFVVYSLAVLPCMLLVSFCFSGVLPIIAAMITDVTNEENRKVSFSLLFLCINIGFALGQVFAGSLFYAHTRWIFWGQGIAFFTATLLIAFCVKEKDFHQSRQNRQQEYGQPEEGQGRSGFLRCLFADKILLLFLTAIVLLMYVYSQVTYLLPLQLSHLFGLKVSARWVSHVWLLNGLFCIVWTPLLLSVTCRRSQIANVAVAALLYFIGMGGYGLVQGEESLWVILLCTPIWTAGEVLLSTGSGVFIAARAPEDYRAGYQSLYEFASATGRCIGPVTMGYFLTVGTYSGGWMLAAGLALSACVLLLFCRRIASGK